MIGYVTMGTNDIKKAAGFYDKLCGEMGMRRIMELDTFIVWGGAGRGGGFALAVPYDGRPMSVGNGVMAAFAVKDKAEVDRVTRWPCRSAAAAKALPGRAPKTSTPPTSGIPRATSSTPT